MASSGVPRTGCRASLLHVSTINLPYALRVYSAGASPEEMVLYICEAVKHRAE